MKICPICKSVVENVHSDTDCQIRVNETKSMKEKVDTSKVNDKKD